MSRGARSVAQTKARFTGPPAFPDSLLFSPHGEAKCVRGPSGLGASRAEEKGASRLARAGVLDRTLSTASKRNKIMAVISCASTVGWWEMQARATPSRGQRFFTNHETRNTAFFLRGARRAAPPETAVRTTAPAGKPLFSCSPLFTIVQQKNCSASLPSRRPVAAFLRVVARHGAAMARHGRPPSPAPATRPVGFSRITNHETRITAFTLFFPRFPTISRHFPRFPGPPTPLGKGPRAVQSLLPPPPGCFRRV